MTLELTAELIVALAALCTTLLGGWKISHSRQKERSERDKADGALSEWRRGVNERLNSRRKEHEELRGDVAKVKSSVDSLAAELRGSGHIKQHNQQ